jgi:hypothetical protein
VHRKFEPVGQERLQHQPHPLLIGVALEFGLDIVAFRADAGRTAYHLKILDAAPG